MNKREKEVIQNQLNSEKEVLQKIKGVYEDALTGINDKIKLLMSDELTQSKIYQIEYQKALKGQISAILDAMNDQQYEKVSDYLNDCYENGFIGTFYSLQNQGVPLVIPIDQEQIVQAIEKDTKLSEPLYKRLGQDVDELKTAINAEISRGIASALPYSDIARNIKNRTNVGINRTMTIARTEGHRVNQEASYHAQIKAKERGADIVKQWDSTLDSRTRKSHAALDGQIREVEEPFEIKGRSAMHPSDFGVASEDVNCRCVCLQRAKWAITDEEFTKMNGDTGELIRMKEKDYQSFKDSYKKQVKEISGPKDFVFPQAEYKPLSSVQECEDFAKKLTSGGTPIISKKSVDFNGLDVDQANTICRTLNNVLENTKIDKPSTIEVFGKKNRKYYERHENAPMATSNFGNLFINKEICKTGSAIDSYMSDGKDAFDLCIANKSKFTGSKLELIERYEKVGKQLVGDSFEDMVVHETGHLLSYSSEFNKPLTGLLKTTDWEQYAQKLSGYASHSFGEYVAESWSSFYKYGEKDMQPELLEIFRGVMKNGTDL